MHFDGFLVVLCVVSCSARAESLSSWCVRGFSLPLWNILVAEGCKQLYLCVADVMVELSGVRSVVVIFS